jgi:hypothetical protein
MSYNEKFLHEVIKIPKTKPLLFHHVKIYYMRYNKTQIVDFTFVGSQGRELT